MSTKNLTRRDFLKMGAVAGGSALLASCGGGATPTAALPDLTTGESIPLDQLTAAVQAEGATLNVIALPRDWANYGELIDTFKTKYGFPITVNEINPEAGSGDELEAIRANRESVGPQAPDTVDIGIGHTKAGMDDGLFAKYKVSTWDTIPMKNEDGYWWAEYYGVLTYETNLDVVTNVPADWEDLLKDEYRNMVGLAGDPTSSNEAIMSVMAAGLSRTNNDIATAPQAGLEFFAELNAMGNLVPVTVTAGTMASGETPIGMEWDYLAMGNRDTLAGNPELAITVPTTGVLAGPYAGAISAYAPHPYCARLWWEYLMSDEGQLLWLKGYAHPIRFNDLAARGVIPAELTAALPPAEAYAQAVFLTVDQLTASKDYISTNWRTVVLGEA